MLEIAAGTKILELRLNHRAEIARRVVAELDYATWIALEHEDHSTPDLGGRHCHIDIPILRSETEIDAGFLPFGADREEA